MNKYLFYIFVKNPYKDYGFCCGFSHLVFPRIYVIFLPISFLLKLRYFPLSAVSMCKFIRA